MMPETRSIIEAVAAETGVAVRRILSSSRVDCVVQARREVIRRLDATGRYSSTQIGIIVRRDHTTVLFALGRLEKKPSRPKWRKPFIGHVKCNGCRFCSVTWPPKPVAKAPKQVARVRRYLVPYAGADADYVLKRRAP